MDERELIARLQKRDEAAFEELIRQYEKKVYTLCFRMCGNSEDAEEAAQDAFLALWRGIDRFRQESSLSTWIYRLATNACIDTLRRRKKQSVCMNPKILFFDEPTSALDPELTGEILKVIKDLAAEHITMVIVTHEMTFARDISDHIIFMDKGLIAVEGTSQEVFASEHARMKEFLGKFHRCFSFTLLFKSACPAPRFQLSF